MKFEPAGLTDDPDVRMSQSIMDYTFRRLALDYLDYETRSALGIYSADERQRYLDTGSYEPLNAGGTTAAELIESVPSPSMRPPRWSRTTRSPASEASARGEDEPRGVRDGQRDGSRHPARPPRRPHERRAPRGHHRLRGRLPALHDLRHQDAPRRLLPRLRRLRQHQRLQLSS